MVLMEVEMVSGAVDDDGDGDDDDGDGGDDDDGDVILTQGDHLPESG